MSWYESDMNLWWNIKNIRGSLTYPFTRVFWWMVKSFQYSILLWKDCDWDYFYILILLQYKLKRTRKRILADNIVLHTEEVGAQIKHAEDLIQNWRDNNWCKDLQEMHEEKWGNTVNLFDPINVIGKRTWRWDMPREKATTPELQKQEKKEQRAIYQAMYNAEEECWNEIFDHIKEYGKNWWN